MNRLLLLSVLMGGQVCAQHCHQQGNIRIFYHAEGQHAVEAADANHNAVPDQVEDAMTQIMAARMLFVEALGFPDPFQGERFRSASFLDVHFRHKDVLKSNGVAYDELQRYKRPQDPPGTLSLCFNIATSVRPSANLTPSHEFFHIIQNGVTYFKNSWYTEGTARWSERGLGAGGLGPARLAKVWPQTEAESTALFQRSYDASEFFWNVLARQHDRDGGQIPASPTLRRLQAMRYVDGTPVLRDTEFSGWRFIRTVLLELGSVQQNAAKELGYDTWSEPNQRAPQNGTHILRAVRAVAQGWKQ